MGKEQELQLYIGEAESKTVNFENGIRVIVQRNETSVLSGGAGEVETHEAIHAAVAPEIDYATNIISGDALGTTVPRILTAEAAAAPAALGYHKGTSWDKIVTERFLRIPWERAKAAARAKASGLWDLIHNLARKIKVKGTIFQHDVEESKTEIADRKRGIYSVNVIYDSGKSFSTKTSHGFVNIPVT